MRITCDTKDTLPLSALTEFQGGLKKRTAEDTKKIEKTGVFSRNKEYTSLGHLDSVDAVEYAFTHYKKYFKR